MFECNGEVDKFAYDDCKIIKVNVSQNVMAFTVEALAVEPDNSQNNNFTKSYAGDTDIVFTDMQIVKAVKEGYRYYDADGNLVSDEPDRELTEDELKELVKGLEGDYLYGIKEVEDPEAEKKRYVIGIELPAENPEDVTEVTDSYQMLIECKNVKFSWEKYMNRIN